MPRDSHVPPATTKTGRSRPGRVLLIADQLFEDGATNSNLRLVSRWVRSGVPVVLLALRRREDTAALPPGVMPVYPSSRKLRQRWQLVLGVWRAVRLARTADVVVAGRETGWGLLVARFASLVAHRPLVVIVRSEAAAAVSQYMHPLLQPLARRAITSATRVACISPGLAPACVMLGVPPARIRVVLNGVDVPDILRLGREPARLLPGLARPVVVSTGRLAHQKGFDTLVRAHAQLVQAGMPHTLLLMGDGDQRQALHDLIEELDVAQSVVMPGFVAKPLADVAAADLFCLSSRWEGFGQSLAEALLLGTPTVATDCVSGPRDLLLNGEHGDLVPVDDVDALAAAIRTHLEEPDRLRRAASKGKEWAIAHLSADRCAAEFREVLSEVTSHRV